MHYQGPHSRVRVWKMFSERVKGLPKLDKNKLLKFQSSDKNTQNRKNNFFMRFLCSDIPKWIHYLQSSTLLCLGIHGFTGPIA